VPKRAWRHPKDQARLSRTDGKQLGIHTMFWIEPTMDARLDAIERHEDRPRGQVLRSLIWLGLGVYERLAANLAGPEAVAAGAELPPSPFPSPLRFFADQEMGRTILDGEAKAVVAAERARREAEVERLRANRPEGPRTISRFERLMAEKAAEAAREEHGEWIDVG